MTGPDPRDVEAAETAARILLDTRSVLVHEEPFFFSSGWASPVFVDVKQLISFPLARRTLVELAISRILRQAGYAAVDAIAGGEVAGVPFAAMIADRLHLPLLIVRKQSKGFGPSAHVEGDFVPGARVLLVDDLTTDGRTKATYVRALTRAGASVRHAFVMLKYGIYDRVVRDLDALGVDLAALATLPDIGRVAAARGDLDARGRQLLEAFVADPVGWSAAHGGIGAAATAPHEGA